MAPSGTKAKAILQSLGPDQTKVEVHFNPTSLIYTVENVTKQQAGGPKRKQFAAQFSGKLSMDLQFDTTASGEDVRVTTNKVARFMQSSAANSKDGDDTNVQAQPVLSFQWGAYIFKGTMESFKETIDFFSSDGVPLRALVSITLARQDKVFDEDATLASSKAPSATSLVQTSGGGSVNDLVTRSGAPSAARQLGADNGLESLRFTGGAALEVNGGVQLNGAAGFVSQASTGAGVSASASAGASFGGGAGVSSAASLRLSAGAGGAALFGGQASAGVPATAGAFVGLETGRATGSSTAGLDPLRMLPATVAADVSTGANATFSLGGAATMSSGFSSDVGARLNFADRLTFDGSSEG